MKKYFSRDFNSMSIMLIPIAVAINVIGGVLALSLRLPIYLDVIGTVLVGILGGPWIGGVTGAVSILIKSLQDPTEIPFALIGGAVGVISGLLTRGRMFSNKFKTLISALLVAVVSVLMTVVIRVTFFGGFSTGGTTILISTMIAAGVPFWPAQFIGQVISELPDKIISVFIPYWIIQNMSLRYVVKFPNGPHLIDDLKIEKQKRKQVEL